MSRSGWSKSRTPELKISIYDIWNKHSVDTLEDRTWDGPGPYIVPTFGSVFVMCARLDLEGKSAPVSSTQPKLWENVDTWNRTNILGLILVRHRSQLWHGSNIYVCQVYWRARFSKDIFASCVWSILNSNSSFCNVKTFTPLRFHTDVIWWPRICNDLDIDIQHYPYQPVPTINQCSSSKIKTGVCSRYFTG